MQIKLHNVNKSYASGVETIHVLREMSFTIDGGKWLTITGPSGSGKTTLLRCISAIELVNDGEVVVGELQANTATEDERRRFRRDNIGYIFQDFQLRSEEHTSELQSRGHLVCRLLLEKKKNTCSYQPIY